MNTITNKLKRITSKNRTLYRLAFPLKNYFCAKAKGLVWHNPNYFYFDWLDSSSIVFDVGCGPDADFSVYLIRKHGLKCFVVDPTHKHREELMKLEADYPGKFKHLCLAVSSKNEKVTFHESMENMSGSLLSSHRNVKNDTINSYVVDSVTPSKLLESIGLDHADLLKLDIEGAEFELLTTLDLSELKAFKQIFVEFHPGTVDGFSEKNVTSIIERFSSFGFKFVTLGSQNYLFF